MPRSRGWDAAPHVQQPADFTIYYDAADETVGELVRIPHAMDVPRADGFNSPLPFYPLLPRLGRAAVPRRLLLPRLPERPSQCAGTHLYVFTPLHTSTSHLAMHRIIMATLR